MSLTNRPIRKGTLAEATATTTHITSRRTLLIPLYGTLAYLGGTFLLFLTVGQVSLVNSMARLITFVVMTLLAFGTGYLLRIKQYGSHVLPGTRPIPVAWIKVSAGYYAVYGAALLLAYGATGPVDVLRAILNPGPAYAAKFDVYAQQTAAGVRNPVIQIMTLIAVLATPLIPFAVLFWSRLTTPLRLAVLASAGIYASFFLFIGTLKGLGDLLVFVLAAYLIRTVWPSKMTGRRSRRRLVVIALIGILAFVGYMAYNQSQRLQELGGSSRFQSSPLVASLVGDELAKGLAVVAFYPTHGYVGLAYNLDTPFVWSEGLGASRALNSYWMQYMGGKGASESAYPYRTETLTGWPSGAYWSTIYPWLASDLTFPGTIAFMGVLGWLYAMFWYEAAYRRSLLSVLMFCQLTLLLFYVPANNQIGLSRTSLIAFVCLSITYVANRLTRPLARR